MIISMASEGVGASDRGSEVASPDLGIISSINATFPDVSSEADFLGSAEGGSVRSSDCGCKLGKRVDASAVGVPGVAETSTGEVAIDLTG
mgnify:CR=1 FL=1